MVDRLIQDINQVWDPKRFSIPHRPYTVRSVPSGLVLSPKKDVLDMPIRLPYGSLCISDEAVKEIVGMCFQFEKLINPELDNYYCYLTINQGVVRSGGTQRKPGVHFDGMQGVRYPEHFRVCHQYLVASALPTNFYVQSFDASKLEPGKHNWFAAFEAQKKEDNRYAARPFDLVFMTAYCPHAATVAEEPTDRTFIRVEFSLKRFDRLGNSVNPQMETGWTYEERPIPGHLI